LNLLKVVFPIVILENNKNLMYLHKDNCYIYTLQQDRPDGSTKVYATDNSSYPCFVSVKTLKDPIGDEKLFNFLEALLPDFMYQNKEEWLKQYNSELFANGFIRIIFSSVGGFTFNTYQLVKDYNSTSIGKKFPIILLCAHDSFLKENSWKDYSLLQKKESQNI